MKKHKNYESYKRRKIIFSLELCDYLMCRGYKLITVDSHKDKSGRLIFIFENSNELHYAIDEFFIEKRAQKNKIQA